MTFEHTTRASDVCLGDTIPIVRTSSREPHRITVSGMNGHALRDALDPDRWRALVSELRSRADSEVAKANDALATCHREIRRLQKMLAKQGGQP